MKALSTIFLLSILVLGCHKKSLPLITRRSEVPTHTVPIEKKEFVIDASRGQAIFNRRCDRCHALPDPKEFPAEKWETILSRMAPRARLSREETIHVAAYIKASGK